MCIRDSTYSFQKPYEDSTGLVVPELLLFDSDGEEYTIEDLQFRTSPPPPGQPGAVVIDACQAGMFNIQFLDDILQTGIGFDGNTPNGDAMGNVVCQVFTDISELLGNAFPQPYNPGILNPQIDIIIAPSISEDMGSFQAYGSQFYIGPNKDINHGTVWYEINTGVNPYANLAGFDNFSDIPVANGIMQFNAAPDVIWHTDLSTVCEDDMYDLYTYTLRDALHLLRLACLLDADGTSVISHTSPPGIYSEFDDLLRGNGNNIDMVQDLPFEANFTGQLNGSNCNAQNI